MSAPETKLPLDYGPLDLMKHAAAQLTAIREENARLREALKAMLRACDAAKPYIVRTIQNDPDAPWMKGQPKEVGTLLLEQIELARAALATLTKRRRISGD